MGYERGGSDIGLVEKAAKIAVRYHILFDPTTRNFIGDAEAVAKAVQQLDAWQLREARKQREAGW